MQKSKGHVEFIGKHEYYQQEGALYRAEISHPLVAGRRQGKFITSGKGIEFALRLARLAIADVAKGK